MLLSALRAGAAILTNGAADALCFDARTAGGDEPCAAQLNYITTHTYTFRYSHTPLHTQADKQTHAQANSQYFANKLTSE